MGRFGSAHFGSAARVLVRLRSLLCLLFSFCSLPGLLVGSFGAGKWGEISSSQPVIMHTIYLRLIFDWIKEFQPRPVNLRLGPIFWLVLSLSRLRLGSRLILGSWFSVSLSLWSSALNCRPWPLFVSFGLPLWSDFCFAVQRVKG